MKWKDIYSKEHFIKEETFKMSKAASPPSLPFITVFTKLQLSDWNRVNIIISQSTVSLQQHYIKECLSAILCLCLLLDI